MTVVCTKKVKILLKKIQVWHNFTKARINKIQPVLCTHAESILIFWSHLSINSLHFQWTYMNNSSCNKVQRKQFEICTLIHNWMSCEKCSPLQFCTDFKYQSCRYGIMFDLLESIINEEKSNSFGYASGEEIYHFVHIYNSVDCISSCSIFNFVSNLMN